MRKQPFTNAIAIPGIWVLPTTSNSRRKGGRSCASGEDAGQL